jgi:signal transduction histidine kinase
LDFASNPTLLTSVEIPVFRRVDKVVRIFRATGNAKRLTITIQGTSFGQVKGPNVFELIPFAILDNAIKYSPAGQQISVQVAETPKKIEATFSSIGPQIKEDEIEKIFEKKYRGVNAVGSSSVGTGIGLSNAKTLVQDHFGGDIMVRQTLERFAINNVPYLDTEFTISFPRIV